MKLSALSGLPVHPAADAFPYLSDDETTTLAQDIEANGLIHPIVLFEGTVLDGRNRLRALAQTNVTDVATTDYAGDDPIGYVLSLNVHRRHLDTYQWVEVAAKLKPAIAERAAARQGTRTDLTSLSTDNEVGRSNELVSDALQNAVSATTLARGWALMERAPEAWAEAKRTKTGIATAYKAMSEPKDPNKDRILVERVIDKHTGAIERKTVARELGFADQAEKILELLSNLRVDLRRQDDRGRAAYDRLPEDDQRHICSVLAKIADLADSAL